MVDEHGIRSLVLPNARRAVGGPTRRSFAWDDAERGPLTPLLVKIDGQTFTGRYRGNLGASVLSSTARFSKCTHADLISSTPMVRILLREHGLA